MDKTRTIGQEWLANERDLHFLTLKKCTKGQSILLIISKVILLTNYSSSSNRGGGGKFYTSDENVKILMHDLIEYLFDEGHYYFVKKLKIVEKQLCKLNCSYGKVSHTLNRWLNN